MEEDLVQQLSALQVDGRAFAFALKRMEALKLENERLQRSLVRTSVETRVLQTSALVGKLLAVDSKSSDWCTLNSRLKNLLPKPEKVELLRALLTGNPQAISTWRDMACGGAMLHIAAENGNLPAVKLLVEAFAHPLDLLDLFGRTALHRAANKQQMDVCLYLTEVMGSDLVRGENAPVDMAGYTPAALSALAMNMFDYDAEKQRAYEQQRKSVKRFLHVKGDACVSPRRSRANAPPGTSAMRSTGKSKLRMQQQQLLQPSPPAFGMFLMNGWGIKMEDFCFVSSPVEEDLDLHVFAVLDGHGGALCAKRCTEMLPGLLATQSLLSTNGEEEGAQELAEFAQSTMHGLELGLQALPEFAWRQVEIRPAMGNEPAQMDWQIGDGSGTTCVLALVTKHLLCVAHVGDSRAALITPERDFAITMDHKLTAADDADFVRAERERIEANGGYIINDKRVSVDKEGKTSLGMTRALGDFWAKRDGRNVVSAEPQVWVAPRPKEESFLVLASDGIWDVVTEKQVGDFIRARLNPAAVAAEEGEEEDRCALLNQIANDLCDHCLELDSQDNMSVIIVDLQQQHGHFPPPVRKPVFD